MCKMKTDVNRKNENFSQRSLELKSSGICAFGTESQKLSELLIVVTV